VRFSSIEGAEAWPGEGNIASDPLFVEEGRWDDRGTPGFTGDDVWIDGDYRLLEGSPAIDTAASDGIAEDISGNLRSCGLRPDMGAHERCGPEGPAPFRRGDATADGAWNITDVVLVLDFLFRGGAEPGCREAGDSNGDGALNLSDAAFLLGYLFLGRPGPPEPFTDCGRVEGPLGCASYAACE
jgi:hypothetical protein